ncbi:MAG: phosphatidylserine decarboxylase [Planctomycetota bacterium]
MRKSDFDDVLEALPIARWAFFELQAVAIVCFLVAVGLALAGPPWWWALPAPLLAPTLLAAFCRDPLREPPADASAYYSPADGKVVAVEQREFDETIGEPATRVDIFLSVFDVHITRVPRHSVILTSTRQAGGYRNALRAEAARSNNAVLTTFRDPEGRPFAVRQISGLIARRIVADVAEGDQLAAGQKYGMIKFGSRTELIMPADCEVVCAVGDRVRAGVTVLARVAGDG